MKSLLRRWDVNEEIEIWKKAIFVFDSSALLNFYEFSDYARHDIYNNIFPILKNRLWITNQTEYEFLKHKDKVASKPEQLYREIKEQHYPTKHFKAFMQQYEQLKTRTGKDNRHPYIATETFEGFDAALKEFVKHQQGLEEALNNEIERRLSDHTTAIKNDALLSFFQVTNGYTYSQLMEIVKEGEFRYRHKIPPGYADEKEKEEFGVTKFGDLIAWKQIIGLAKQIGLPILLVIDDLKTDWCITAKDDKGKLIAPREELIKEMNDEGGALFWSYSSSQFVFKANDILKSKIAAEVIEEVWERARKQHNMAEQSVFLWVQQRFNADETIWAGDFWEEDSGADIIQTLDGVLFSIQVKYFEGMRRIKDVNASIEQARSIKNSKVPFESNIIVFVGETQAIAESLQEITGSNSLRDFELFFGYVDEKSKFIEIASRTKH